MPKSLCQRKRFEIFLKKRDIAVLMKLWPVVPVLCFLISFCGPLVSCGGGAAPAPLQPKDCSGKGPSKEVLEQKKEQLFEDIQNSDIYSSKSARKKELENQKTQIRTMEGDLSKCPEDIERHIDSLSSLLRRGPLVKRRRP